jgi:hypothetical protein
VEEWSSTVFDFSRFSFCKLPTTSSEVPCESTLVFISGVFSSFSIRYLINTSCFDFDSEDLTSSVGLLLSTLIDSVFWTTGCWIGTSD